MAISPVQKRALEEVIQALCAATKGRRRICEMFMELPSKEAWPEYYKVIPEPRCLDGIKSNVERGKYKDAIVVYDDLMLVFANALHYNEVDSQIAKDATTLKGLLEETWRNNTGLPPLPSSPPATEQTRSSAAPMQSAITAPATTVSDPSPSSTSPIVTSAGVQPNAASATSMATNVSQPNQIIDDEGDMSPEPPEHENESHTWEFAARDEESAEIVRQLERGLPRWEGGDDRGWLEEPEDAMGKYIEILGLLKGYRTPTGQRPWSSLDEIPEDAQVKNLSFSGALSFKITESRARTQHYGTARDFDQDLSRLFEKARRWHTAGTEGYGNCILLQRLYHLLTSSPFPSSVPLTTSNFSSIAAGPGVARPLHSQASESSHAVTTFRIPTKDRTFTEELSYKGMSIRVGDWVHLMNPDEPAKPIIAQVFKTWVPDGDGARKAQQGLTACWYFRPEQTVHPAHRQFWEGEVFKTGHFADHVAEDIIEKIACQFTARHVRGRPRPPYWYPGWPLYVCDSRYNDRERVFVKIKNWNSCIPEDYRKNDFMPIYPFERIIYPKRYPSPFLNGIAGPGGIGDSIERAEGEKIEGGGTGRKRARKNATGQMTEHAGPRYGTYVGPPSANVQVGKVIGGGASQSTSKAPIHAQQKRVEDRSIGTAAGGLANLQGNAVVEVLPAETVKHFDRDPETNQVLWFSGPPIDVARTPLPQYSLKYLHHVATKWKEQKVEGRKRKGEDVQEDRMDVDGGGYHYTRRRQEVRPRMTDTLNDLWASISNG